MIGSRVLEREQFCARLWRKDASLWKADAETQKSIRDALGWLHVAENMEDNLDGPHPFYFGNKSRRFPSRPGHGHGRQQSRPARFPT